MFPLTLELNLESSNSFVKRLLLIPEELHVQGVFFLLQLEHVQLVKGTFFIIRSQDLADPFIAKYLPRPKLDVGLKICFPANRKIKHGSKAT